MNNKYRFADSTITWMGVGGLSFNTDLYTGEILGLNRQAYPGLVDKWLKSGTIVEIHEEETLVEEDLEFEGELIFDEPEEY